jgi:glycosyltransferase involved in cell wall biosynthesis
MPGPAVVVGYAGSMIPLRYAQIWRRLGVETVVVTCDGGGDRRLGDGTPILDAARRGGDVVLGDLRLLAPVLAALEAQVLADGGDRFERALGEFASDPYKPRSTGHLLEAPRIAATVRALDPLFVCGHEVFAYGVATALCHGAPRVLVPWGGDIYYFAETSPIALAMVRFALASVDLVCPSATASAKQLQERFGVPPDRVRPVSAGVDRSRLRQMGPEERASTRARLRIPPGALVVTNIRRFKPPWGSEVALEAFLRVAAADARTHFVCLAGAGGAPYVDAALARATAAGLAARFTFVREDLAPDDYYDLLCASDVGVSLMLSRDMRSASLVQAAGAGLPLLVSPQDEYVEMAKLGFDAITVDPRDPTQVAATLVALLRDAAVRAELVARNQAYLAEHEDEDRQMRHLLDLILSLRQR